MKNNSEKITKLYIENTYLVQFVYGLYVKKFESIIAHRDELFDAGQLGLFKACKEYVEKPKDYKFSTLACCIIKHEMARYLNSLKNKPMEKPISLDELILVKDNRLPMEEKIADDDEKNKVIDLIKEVSFGLDDKEKQIFDCLFEEMSFADIGKKIKLTRQEISRKIPIIIKRIKLLLYYLTTDITMPRLFDYDSTEEFKIDIQKFGKKKFFMRNKPNLDNLKLGSIRPIRNRNMKNNDKFVDKANIFLV